MKNTFRSYDLAVEFYHLSSALSLKGHLKDQLSRAASSVVLNLAEGSGRKTIKDKAHFFQMAFGSIRECQAILHLADVSEPRLSIALDSLAAHTYKLMKNVQGV